MSFSNITKDATNNGLTEVNIEELQKLGNIEFLNSFLTLHYYIFGLLEEEFDLRTMLESSQSLLPNFLKELNPSEGLQKEFMSLEDIIFHTISPEKYLYRDLLEMAYSRGLEVNYEFGFIPPRKELICTDEFRNWFSYMRNNPTYIREVKATNFLGDYDIGYVEDETMGFDLPVREACKILNEKGYSTYWSSANVDDFYKRRSHVVKDKSVGYILIDPQNLDEELKKKLLLDGECKFWGAALKHKDGMSDTSEYYGIWSEISSPDMLCIDLSKDLEDKALELPILNLSEDLEL